MSVVYRNMKDMAIPSFAYVNRHDGSVYIIAIDEDGKKHRRTIGALTNAVEGAERMVPNDYFKSIYQDLWNKEYPNRKIPPHEMSIGIYALSLHISATIGLYCDLQEVYGPVYANSILDYAMFSIIHRSNVTQLFEHTMDKNVLFSDKLHGDSWYSDFFSSKMSEDQHHAFRIRWVERLARNGLKKVWLGIDGSNNDCEARRSFLARFGFPKSHNRNKTIVGYMYAVNAETGMPVTYFAYEGSVPDCQAFQKMATFLGGFKIDVEGVILDRGFAVEEVFRTIEENRWKYVIMLPSDTRGHVEMAKDYGEVIRWKSRYMLENEVLFGISGTKRLFGNRERTSNICLFFDGSNGSTQSVRMSRKILSAKRKAEEAIRSGKRATIAKDLRRYLSIDGEGAERRIVEHYDEWDKSMAGKGFFSLAASAGITPDQANRIYRMRDTSETQFCILKSQEGGNASRVHKTAGIYSKFMESFVSSIIRFEIEASCKLLDMDTNPTIQDLERISLLYTNEDRYEAVRNLTMDQRKLFGLYGLSLDDFEKMAQDFNRRNKTAVKNPERKMPDKAAPTIIENSHKKGRKKRDIATPTEKVHLSEKREDKPKSKVGRPKGKKDASPRKPRSDKGKKRGRRKQN